MHRTSSVTGTYATPCGWFCVLVGMLTGPLMGEDLTLHTFSRQQLTDVYFSEGAAAGDLDNDQVPDVVYGPYWFAGPEYTEKHEIYEPVPQDRNRYADNFFSWVYDFDGDGWKDVFVVGFPGTPAYVYQNPGRGGLDAHWKKRQVFDWVSNESPQLIDLIGDERPELVCTRDGFFGFATIDWEEPFAEWRFHPVSEQITARRFGHGLGIGDVNGDGRQDIIHAKGWFEQPAEGADRARWRQHQVSFSNSYGGAEMYAYDVDGDGDNDIITSHAAHDFGLGWYEQVRKGNEISFRHHLIMGAHPAENRYGLVFSELHSVNLADLDGDGLKDIVTGKTYWSHHTKSPMWDAGAVVYWFKLKRTGDGVEWIPYQADGESGIGRQLTLADLNGDGRLDMVLGGMKGAHVLRHRAQKVSRAAWQAAQPEPYRGAPLPDAGDARALRGPKSPRDANTGRVPGALEGEALKHKVTAGSAQSQAMGGFTRDHWSGNAQLWWTGARPGAELTVDLPRFTGTVDLELVLTCARDYGIVQLSLDDQPLGPPIDLYHAEVITTGVLSFSKRSVTGRRHQLKVQIVGAHPEAQKAYMFGLDYLRIRKADGNFVARAAAGIPAARAPAAGDGVRPLSREGRPLNLDFETGTLADWTASGNAFTDQPIEGDTVARRRDDARSGHAGEYWIGGYEVRKDAATGTLTSAPFVISHPYATFLMNGGRHETTRVELVRTDTGAPFYRIAGTNNEKMRRVVVDLRGHMGKEMMIRLVDQHRGPWGHVNFDHFRFHENRPGRATPPMMTLVDDQYPHAGQSAEQAAAAMKLPPGFTVQAAAAEPDVKQPIAMAIDDRGRIWVAEAYEYPQRAEGREGRDRILIFEDSDGNGTLDKRKVFAEGLNLVSGLEVGFGGAWVGAAPYLLFIPDRDGDDVPDAGPQVVLDGWGHQDTHETLNAFIWGPDGWLYGCHGVFTHSRVGPPGTPDDERVPLNAAVWRYHPLRAKFEVFAHGTSNPWGVDFNDHGQAFITACVIPHLYHIVQGGRYQRQAGRHFNPHTYRDIVTIADHLHYLGATPHSGNSKSDAAGGGHAHAGAMIYLGGHWPGKYRNQLFMNNIHGQRLNVDVLEPEGSGYVGRHGPDFLLTEDQASQILNLRYGPDGNVWMIDWYDMQACHRREAELHDRSNGRIYKISWQDESREAAAAEAPNLAGRSDEELARMVLRENDWFVRHSRRLLQERAAGRPIEAAAVEWLRDVATGHANESRRLRAVWALHVTGQLNARLVEQLLRDASPFVRGWAVRLAMEQHGDAPSDALLARFVELARSDPSPVVRRHLASAAQRIPLAQRWHLLAELTRHSEDANDHNLPLLYWYAAEPLAGEDPARALQLAMAAGESVPLLREFMLRRIGSSDQDQALELLVGGLGEAGDASVRLSYLAAIRESLRGRRTVAAPDSWAAVSASLLKSENHEVRLQTTALGVTFGDAAALGVMRARILDRAAPLEARRVALQALLDAKDPRMIPTLQSLLADEAPLREAALRGLAQYDDPRVAPAVLDAYASLTPDQRRTALATLCARASSGVALLESIRRGAISGKELTADLVRQLQFHENERIDHLLQSVWGTVRESAADKIAAMAEYKELVASPSHSPPDPRLGRAVFARTCMKCHVLFGVGDKVGPDLTGSNRSNLDYLLSNIVDPSAVMAKEYRPAVIATVDGRVVTGLVQAENQNALTVRTADGEVVLPKAEIAERRESDKSMMPDDQLRPFSEHEVRSLIAYLRSPRQTPLLATPENVSQFFNGRDLTGWSGREDLWSVEDGELVGRSDGLRRNEWIVSDFAAGDFRLTLEVRLVKNAGNSGIQFRSTAHEGEVSGYQADIGKGWWGKLYEEHGRALLWKQSGEEHVREDAWNTYVIEARGDHVRTWINDQPCVDLRDPEGARDGIFAFQLHSGGATEVRFRNLRLEVPAARDDEAEPAARRARSEPQGR